MTARRLVIATWILIQATSELGAPALGARAPSNLGADRFRTDAISVKFRDGLTIRLRNGELTDLGTNALVGAGPTLAGGGRWERAYSLPEAKIEELCANAAQNLGRPVPDLNLQFHYFLPPGAGVDATVDAFNALPCVARAEAIPLVISLPTPPSYWTNQGYLHRATPGINASSVWTIPGGTGSNVAIADIEFSWNLAHHDLPAITLLGPTPYDPGGDTNHGTAVLGEMLALNNGWGVTGAAHGATGYVVGAMTASGQGVTYVDNAIITALGALEYGDVILIELQMAGPNWTGDPPGSQLGMVPMEWYNPVYNAIVVTVGNGITVVEAAGNGSQNLDDAIYGTGNGGHWPFIPGNDSGAILVGAGAAPADFGGSDVDRSRLSFSNYGATVDLQGWGEAVYTTGYGGLYSAEGQNRYYTGAFNGTSSASPIVAAACAVLQSINRAATAVFLTPEQVKNTLRTTGSPQHSGVHPATDNIGPRPDLAEALWSLNLGGNCLPIKTWTMLSSTGPSPRFALAMTYDSVNKVAIMFGGYGSSAALNDTWQWDGAAWTLRSSLGPSPRGGHAMSFDSARHVAIMFGGNTSVGVNGHTWEWDGVSWGLASTVGPPRRSGHALAYDSLRGVTVLFGGGGESGVLGDTWEWDGASWTLRATSGPSPRSGHAMTFDDDRGVVVLCGGYPSGQETWEWDGLTWTLRGNGPANPNGGASLVYDSVDRVTVLYGWCNQYYCQGETWRWDGETWTKRSITNIGNPYGNGMIYDASRDEIVLFGGYGSGYYFGNTWTLRGNALTVHRAPVGQTVQAGQRGTLDVTVTGGSPITYQWRKNGVGLSDGSRVSGATARTLVIDPVEPSDTGSYDVAITNPCGTTIAGPATVTVSGSCLPCDLDCNGTVNQFDIQPFVNLLMPPEPQPCSPCAGDANGNGTVNQFDINGFVECLGG